MCILKVDVGLDKVMPNGAGLTHSSFCMAEIEILDENGNLGNIQTLSWDK